VKEVYLGLGTNLGNREENLLRALSELVKLGPLERSYWYETEPVEMSEGGLFLNGVVRLWTELTPPGLLAATRAIEEQMGRKRSPEEREKKPRVIDIDILFYNQMVVTFPDLVVPHPRLPERAFVLVPMVELAPDFRHPVLGLTVEEMLERVSTAGVRRWNGN